MMLTKASQDNVYDFIVNNPKIFKEMETSQDRKRKQELRDSMTYSMSSLLSKKLKDDFGIDIKTWEFLERNLFHKYHWLQNREQKQLKDDFDKKMRSLYEEIFKVDIMKKEWRKKPQLTDGHI